jgi:flagellar biosynthesis protein FlhB
VAGEKTEKATPKKREESRKKGQVAKSIEISGSLVTLAGLSALGAFGPAISDRCREVMQSSFLQISDPSVVTPAGATEMLGDAGLAAAAAVAPIAFVCAVVGTVTMVVQVGPKPMPGAIKPRFSKLNPVNGVKNLLGPNALVMLVTNLLKLVVLGSVVYAVLVPNVGGFASLVGAGPHELVAQLHGSAMQIARFGTVGWFMLAIVDLLWQRHRHEKQLKMSKQDVKDEHKQQDMPAEAKMAQKRRQMQQARARMMAAVPEADVVVTNPTHFAVALKYGTGMEAPTVVAKGQDLLALRIRAIADEHGVPIVPDPPLARALHATVEVGREIPEELYQAVAKVLAFVFRMAGRGVA